MKDSTDHATQDILDATEKRGRKPMSAATPREAQTIAEALVSANQAVALLDERASRVRAVALQMGYQLPGDGVDADLIQRDIAANMRRSVEACLEVGRGLAVLKEACEHGEFRARLEVLGVEKTVATRFMLAAVRGAETGDGLANGRLDLLRGGVQQLVVAAVLVGQRHGRQRALHGAHRQTAFGHPMGGRTHA